MFSRFRQATMKASCMTSSASAALRVEARANCQARSAWKSVICSNVPTVPACCNVGILADPQWRYKPTSTLSRRRFSLPTSLSFAG
jgi:hypothetical protein